ncbi:MAG: methionine--tRNA ligase [Candidatus Moraniibacteriota bacterium]|nr:MAG: methionine--tRNA ligase [Candidatus Moranbacteria bacterium]
MNKNFYITTTLPYVNAKPHIGFASEIVYADVRARYEQSLGKDVVFNTGTDEHGMKIYQSATQQGISAQEYVDEYAAKFDDLKKLLNLNYTHFIRTTDEHHKKATQEMWRRVDANGFIYKKKYSAKYCVGCELEKTDSELEDGFCPLHPGKKLEKIDEENYFFKFSDFGDKLLKLYQNNPEFVVPQKRFNEIKSFVERGLQDFSISRLKEKMPWGVSVPDDEEHVMYVWFDALTNYVSTLGWPEDEENFAKFWGTVDEVNAIQIAGKDNLRQQSAVWQAMLMAADLPHSKQVFINGFISVDGQKMSKSIGNVIAPTEMVEKYGIDGSRYLLLTKGNFGEDNDISWEKLNTKYNADLANGLGNLTSRIITLAGDVAYDTEDIEEINITEEMQKMQMNKALVKIWTEVEKANKRIEEKKPWELKKTDTEAFENVMKELLLKLHTIAQSLTPFMPQTSEEILEALKNRERIILFQRVEL